MSPSRLIFPISPSSRMGRGARLGLAALALAIAAVGAPVAGGSAHEEDEDEMEETAEHQARFEFKDFCGVALSGDVLTLAGGGLVVNVDVSAAKGNLNRASSGQRGRVTLPTVVSAAATVDPSATATATAIPTTSGTSVPSGADRLTGRLVRVKGSVLGGTFMAHEAELTGKRCETTGGPSDTPVSATSTPATGTATASPTSTATDTGIRLSSASATPTVKATPTKDEKSRKDGRKQEKEHEDDD